MHTIARRGLLTLALLVTCGVRAQPAPGLYFDPQHDGHGFDLQAVGERWVMVLYSYDDAGQPEWFLGTLESDDEGNLSGRLDQFDYQADRQPPQQLSRIGGDLSLEPDSDCGGGVPSLRFRWQLLDQSGEWCVRPLLAQDGVTDEDFTGLWYAGESDVGWGLSLDFSRPASGGGRAGVIFYYDAEGMPRWALGSASEGAGEGSEGAFDLFNFTGYCRGCDPSPLVASAAGRLEYRFELIDGWPRGEVAMALDYALEGGGSWDRSGAIVPLSDPVRGLIPMPDTIAPDRPVLITDVSVVSTDGSQATTPHQSVLVQDGLIRSVGPVGTVAVPGNAIRIDGRDLFLGPGLSEMHLHIDFGGQSPADEAGLLMIANGVTTALNMGNGIFVDVPALADRFAAGELIGPTFYTGQVAFGPSDNASAPQTVRTPQQADSYIDQIAAEGFDYLKVYWGITPEMMTVFSRESRRLEMPIIGHVPRTQASRESFLAGHRMAAHVQEPWVTFLNQQFDDERLPEAAAEFLEFDVYLTPTLAVFESYTSLYGGNLDAYNALIEREGHTVTSPFVRNGWRNYFNSTNIQGNGQVIGGLDDMYQFFLRLTLAFHEAGVPLLVGTDAPGFPGVMSGYGAIREMELLEEAGLSPADVYQAATFNAGRFVVETLGETPFGEVRANHRADLILLGANPLLAVDNVRDPALVMSGGRAWSRAFLDARLAELAERYGFAKHEPSLWNHDPGLPLCADHLSPIIRR